MLKNALIWLCLFLSSALAAEPSDIIPAPKEIKFGQEKISLDGFLIVLQSKSPQAGIAAEWINRRLKQLGGKALPVLERKPAQGKYILIGEAGNLQIPTGFPVIPENEQGYVIQSENDKVILTGRTPVSTLYAAVTFGQMLEATGNGITAVSGSVSDWPDFNYRTADGTLEGCWLRTGHFNGKIAFGTETPPPDARFECIKEQLDFMLSVKLNIGRMYKNQLPPELAEKVKKYASERGIYLYMQNSIFPFQSVGNADMNKDKPEFKGVRISQRHRNDFVAWGRDDLLLRQAEMYSDWVKNGCFDFVYCESIDTGLTTLNYSEWNDRSADDKRRFGDDRGAADCNVINLIYQTIRKNNSAAKFVITLYPYSTDMVMASNFPENMGLKMPSVFAARERKKLKDFYAKVQQGIPSDIRLLYREGPRKDIEAFRKLFPGRSFEIYFEFGGDGYRPVFATNPRFSKSFYFDNRNDMIYYSESFLMCQLAINPVQAMLCANYAWNVNDSGSGYFQYYISPQKDSLGPDVIMKHFVPAACRYLWGEKGKYFEPLMTGGIYGGMIENPDNLLKLMKMRLAESKTAMERSGTPSRIDLSISPEEFISADGMKRQYEASHAARKSLEQLLQQDNRAMPLNARRYVPHFYKYALLWEIYAEIWMYYMKAKESYQAGNISGGDLAVSQGKSAVSNMDAKLTQAARDTAGMPDMYAGYPAYPTPVSLSILGGHKDWLVMPKELMNKFCELEANKKKLANEVIVAHADIGKYTKRELVSRKTSGVPTPDLNSAIWKNATTYSEFLKYELGNPVFKLAANRTEFILLHDDRNLYAGVICHVTPGSGAQASSDKSVGGFWDTKGDFVELFFEPSVGGTYFHLAVKPDGTRYSAAHIQGQAANEKWGGEWHVETVRSSGQWTAMFTIPFKTLEATPDRCWRGNFARQCLNSFPQEYSCFAPVKKNFHDVENYSTISFEK